MNTTSPFFSKLLSARRPMIAALLILGAFFLLPHAAFAQDAGSQVATSAGFAGGNLLTIIGRIIRVFMSFLGVVALLIILYAGWLWMTAGGDDKRVERAKLMMRNGVVGLIIILSAYAIVAFVFNRLGFGFGSNADGSSNNGQPSIERLSGALGSVIEDHYPARNAVDVPRNARIMVTFRQAVDPASIIEGYDIKGTPAVATDDVVTDVLNVSNVKIYATADKAAGALTTVKAYVTPDFRTFVFDPADYLGSATANVNYTVALGTGIKLVDGSKAFTRDSFAWTFTTSTLLDLSAPTVVAALPAANGTFDRNILAQITFSEAIDPTSATGKRLADSGFDNITTSATGGAPTAGEYVISNAYRTVTFVPAETCGTNSCGETLYCLPPSSSLGVTIKAAPLGTEPPQAAVVLPYAGIVDVSGNSLDGNRDGTAGDNFSYAFKTTGAINTLGPKIAPDGVSPRIEEGSVSLDRVITVAMDDVLMSSSVSADAISLANKSQKTGEAHEQWYRSTSNLLDAAGVVVTSLAQVPVSTRINIDHGTMLASSPTERFDYGMFLNQKLRNQYQNCYVPAEGPGADENGMCAVGEASPNCCQGQPSVNGCQF